jgi:hypothetical protein
VLKAGGVLVSSAACPNRDTAAQHGVEAVFFLVTVDTATLNRLASLIDTGEVKTP